MTLKKLLKKRPECGEYQSVGIDIASLSEKSFRSNDGKFGGDTSFIMGAFQYRQPAKNMHGADWLTVIHVSDEKQKILLLEGKVNV